MADGNFNRNILPYNNYRSGVRAGRSSERSRVMKIFVDFISEEHLADNENDINILAKKFHAKIFEEKL